MKKIVKFVAITTAIVMLAGSVGCAKSTVAKVNGEVITRAELDKAVARSKAMYEAQGFQFDGDHGSDTLAELERTELDGMISEKLLKQEAAKMNIQIDEGQVETALKKTKAGFPDEQTYQQALKENQITEEELKEKYRIQLMGQALFDTVTKDVQVTDEDVEKYYNENLTLFSVPEKVRASHILVNTEEEAKAIIEQLKTGADFAQLAAEKSIDPTAKDNKGDLDFFEKEKMVKEFADAAFAMQVGEISQTPVKTEFGYHVIKLTDRKAASKKSLEEAREEARKELLNQKKSETFNQFMNQAKEQANIEIMISTKKTGAPGMPTDPAHGE